MCAQPLQHASRTVGGLDVHGDRGAVAILSYPELRWQAGAIVKHQIEYPYIPGLLSFRKVPVLLAAIERIQVLPDLFLCDGHGLACHLGVRLDHPTIGCAKTLLSGRHARLATARGATALLREREQTLGQP